MVWYDADTMQDQNSGEKKVRVGKLAVDRGLCIGAASCIAVAPTGFELDTENKAVIRRKTPPSVSAETLRAELEDQTVDDETLLLAAKSCPTQAIRVYDEEGNQLYP